MIDCTRLLCGKVSASEGLRYGGYMPPSSRDTKPVVVWNVTGRCNLYCIHCYANATNREPTGELTTEEAKAFIDDLAKMRVPVLLFSGGEPLMRKDLFELGEYATRRGIRAIISTNGTLITPEVAGKIKGSGFKYVGVSLDGIGQTNDKFRGKKGAFDEAIQGIRNCRMAGIKTGLRFTITKHNYRDIPEIFRLLVEEGIKRCCFYHLVYSGRGAGLAEQDLSHQETRQVMDLIFEKTRELYEAGYDMEILTVDNHADGPYLYLKVLRENSELAGEVLELLKLNGGNASGTRLAAVDNLGYVHADQFWHHYSFGNVKERKFSEIWMDTSDPLMRGLKDKKSMVKGRCRLCRYLDICGGGFRVRAEAIYGDIWAEDPACYLTDEEIS